MGLSPSRQERKVNTEILKTDCWQQVSFSAFRSPSSVLRPPISAFQRFGVLTFLRDKLPPVAVWRGSSPKPPGVCQVVGSDHRLFSKTEILKAEN
jgi:hypothetical protein